MRTRTQPMLSRLKGWLTGDRRHPDSFDSVARAEWHFYVDRVAAGMTVFDVGANVGEFTLLFSRFVGQTGSVHAFEPCRSTFEKLSAVCREQGRTNVQVNHNAMSSQSGTADLHTFGNALHSMNSLAKRPLADYGLVVNEHQVETVPTTSLDDYCRRRGVDQIDLLKVDVEGAELDVLRGGERMLREQRVRCCVFETGQTTVDMGYTREQLGRLLREYGYRVRNLLPGRPTWPEVQPGQTVPLSLHIAEPHHAARSAA